MDSFIGGMSCLVWYVGVVCVPVCFLCLACVAWQGFSDWRRDKRGMRKRFKKKVLGRRIGRIGDDTHCLYWFQVGNEVIGVNNNKLREIFSSSFEQVDSHQIR